jgi:hypothetical protein
MALTTGDVEHPFSLDIADEPHERMSFGVLTPGLSLGFPILLCDPILVVIGNHEDTA